MTLGTDWGSRSSPHRFRPSSGADDAWTDPRDLFWSFFPRPVSRSPGLSQEAHAAKIFGCKRNRLGQRPLHNVMRARTQLDKNCLHTRLLLLCLGLRPLLPPQHQRVDPVQVGLGLALRGFDLEVPLHELQKELHLPLVRDGPRALRDVVAVLGGGEEGGGVSRSLGRLGRKRIGLPRVSRA